VLSHHELCFGCGRTNLFGLLLELERQADGSARGRCFIKQDHQGAERGRAHEGVIAAALSEAIALAAGPQARIRRLQLEIAASAPVGAFVDVEAWPDRARATVEGELVATATASTSDR
jgi:acyl-coenzyme A thioesterase PaaI-like protein